MKAITRCNFKNTDRRRGKEACIIQGRGEALVRDGRRNVLTRSLAHLENNLTHDVQKVNNNGSLKRMKERERRGVRSGGSDSRRLRRGRSRGRRIGSQRLVWQRKFVHQRGWQFDIRRVATDERYCFRGEHCRIEREGTAEDTDQKHATFVKTT